jgi:hypothetical protein
MRDSMSLPRLEQRPCPAVNTAHFTELLMFFGKSGLIGGAPDYPIG